MGLGRFFVKYLAAGLERQFGFLFVKTVALHLVLCLQTNQLSNFQATVPLLFCFIVIVLI